MRILLVHPEFPTTYWGFQYSLALVGKGTTLPPLGLLSVAALLPRDWELRLVDLNVGRLTSSDLRWADVVLVTGMLIQEPSMHQVIAWARREGCRTVVGGPACTTSPSRFSDAHHVFVGEAEERVEELVNAIEDKPGTPSRTEAPSRRPSLREVPVPRFDLLDIDRYRSMCIQTSRGCPFKCEFCDIIEIFGRVPRVKSPAQVVAEVQALRDLGYRGEIFVVDDNFIGNKKAVGAILVELSQWQRRAGYPFTFYTEASLKLASDDKLIASMREAGFTSVFIGIESPDPVVLAQTGKKQNIGTDVHAALDKLTGEGIEVMAGFIVGFDGDTANSFAGLEELLRSAPLPLAMAALLTALPGTALWRRLKAEGRLREHSDGDAFARPNYEPVMDERLLLELYADLLCELYSVEGYYRRASALVEDLGAPAHPIPLVWRDIVIFLRAVVGIGVASPRRAPFWRLVAQSAPRGTHGLRTAIATAIRGEHMIRYTEEVVLPRLRSAARSVAPRGVDPAATAVEKKKEAPRVRLVLLSTAAGA